MSSSCPEGLKDTSLVFPFLLPFDTATASSNATLTHSSTSTQASFPTATYATTGQIAGTAQAPFPGGSGGNGQGALGPDDSYIAAAAQLIASSSTVVCLAMTMIMFVIGGVVVL